MWRISTNPSKKYPSSTRVSGYLLIDFRRSTTILIIIRNSRTAVLYVLDQWYAQISERIKIHPEVRPCVLVLQYTVLLQYVLYYYTVAVTTLCYPTQHKYCGLASGPAVNRYMLAKRGLEGEGGGRSQVLRVHAWHQSSRTMVLLRNIPITLGSRCVLRAHCVTVQSMSGMTTYYIKTPRNRVSSKQWPHAPPITQSTTRSLPSS